MFRKPAFSNTQQTHTLGSSDKHRRRVKALLMLGCNLLILVGGGWTAYFAALGKWIPMGLDLVLAIIGCISLLCALTNRLRAASLLAVPSLLIVISAFCLFIDVPGSGVPRSVHMYLLSLAACSILFFRGEKPVLSVGLPLLCFVACLVFAGSNIGYLNIDLLPTPEVRALGVWVNNAVSFIMLGAVMFIMQADVTVRNAIEADLRVAIAEGHFVLHYQLQVGDDGKIFGAETLLRWLHPQRGMIPPGKFIPVAEETGLIEPIGDWVLKTACAQLVAWAAHPRTANLTLSVNVSASQFRQPDFVQQVTGIVERSGIQPSRLKLELTESMLVNDIEDVIRKMTALQALGVGFSLDDFGTGFSSLSYLKRLPLDQLKIDQSFVRGLPGDTSDMAIVRTLVSLGESLGLTVIAEGVETEEQRDWLHDNGCHSYQGYLFGKPVPVDQFEALVLGSGLVATHSATSANDDGKAAEAAAANEVTEAR